MAHPLRIQRRMKRGWKKPEGAVYVGRPSVWGNPFRTAAAFRAWLERGEIALTELLDPAMFPWSFQPKTFLQKRRETVLEHVGELRGKTLMCWCDLDYECHADVLAELANRVGDA